MRQVRALNGALIVAGLAGAIALAGVIVRPGLLVPIALGAAVAAAVVGALEVVRRVSARDRSSLGPEPAIELEELVRAPQHGLPGRVYDPFPAPAARRRRVPRWLPPLVATVVIASAGIVLSRPESAVRVSPDTLLRVEPVRAVAYTGALVYVAAGDRWRWTEQVDVPRWLFVRHRAIPRRGARPGAVTTAARARQPAWRWRRCPPRSASSRSFAASASQS